MSRENMPRNESSRDVGGSPSGGRWVDGKQAPRTLITDRVLGGARSAVTVRRVSQAVAGPLSIAIDRLAAPEKHYQPSSVGIVTKR